MFFTVIEEDDGPFLWTSTPPIPEPAWKSTGHKAAIVTHPDLAGVWRVFLEGDKSVVFDAAISKAEGEGDEQFTPRNCGYNLIPLLSS